MIDENIITSAAKALLAAAPGAKVILFGSYARGQGRPGSDLDFLVIEPQVKNVLDEMVRLRAALEPVLGPARVPADVLVASADKYEYWRDTPNTVFYEAARSGKIYEQVA
jgi:uncharacterized protein